MGADTASLDDDDPDGRFWADCQSFVRRCSLCHPCVYWVASLILLFERDVGGKQKSGEERQSVVERLLSPHDRAHKHGARRCRGFRRLDFRVGSADALVRHVREGAFPGARASSLSQLFRWRKKLCRIEEPRSDTATLVPVIVSEAASPVSPVQLEAPTISHPRRKRSDVTIKLVRGRWVRVDSDIDTDALGRIRDCVLGLR